MVADVLGPDVFVVLILAVVFLALPLWAIVDAASRPTGAFAAAGSNKAMWIILIAAFWLLTGLIGTILSVVYLASVRPRVRAITR